VDLDRSDVYPVDLFYPLAGFEVNLRGRQTRGRVSDAAFETLRDTLIDRLARVRHADGVPLCRGVYRREELFDGPFADRLPDVIAEFDHDVEADLHFGTDLVFDNPGHPSYPFRGYHSREGLLLMHGPGIEPGERSSMPHVRDVMPTIMQWLDVPVPPNRRGSSIPGSA
jgi:predicted AlkP superfamily phosphohydrolase/phosphomutase